MNGSKKLLWLDLEMTGLEPSQHQILEIACLVTDFSFKNLGEFKVIVHQDEETIANSEEWIKKNLTQLLEESKNSNINLKQAENSLIEFLDKHFDKTDRITIAGNTIHQDRRFIRKYLSAFESRLHYRMLDVSSFKIWVLGTTGETFDKAKNHRADLDILESIDELKWALEKLK